MGQLNVSQQTEIAEEGAKRGKPTADLIAPGKQVIKQQEAFWLLCHEGTLANTGELMQKETSFRHVDTFSDDAITVRVTRVEGQLIGVIDFPSFRRGGKMIAASGIKPRPFVEAIAVAERILPHTPFPEIVILDHADLGEDTGSAVFRPDDVTLSNTGSET